MGEDGPACTPFMFAGAGVPQGAVYGPVRPVALHSYGHCGLLLEVVSPVASHPLHFSYATNFLVVLEDAYNCHPQQTLSSATFALSFSECPIIIEAKTDLPAKCGQQRVRHISLVTKTLSRSSRKLSVVKGGSVVAY